MPEDLLNTCFGEGVVASSETQKHCRICYNTACSRSIGNATQWAKRIAEQSEKIFNPKIASPDDPRYAQIRQMDFATNNANAIRKEVINQRNDWTQPSEEDLQPRMMVQTPTTEPVVLESLQIAGKDGVYTVSLVEQDGVSSWRCTCKAFLYGKTLNGCKHIEQAKAKAPAEKPIAQEPKAPYVDPLLGRKAYSPPTAINTTMPSGGIMVGGGEPQMPLPRPTAPTNVDPWAPAPVKPATIPVGGKVTFGEKK